MSTLKRIFTSTLKVKAVMSRFKVEELCFDLGNRANLTSFKSNPEAFAARYNLTEGERQAILSGDIGAIYKWALSAKRSCVYQGPWAMTP